VFAARNQFCGEDGQSVAFVQIAFTKHVSKSLTELRAHAFVQPEPYVDDFDFVAA